MITGGAGPTELVLDNSLTSLFLGCGVSLLLRHQVLCLLGVLLGPHFQPRNISLHFPRTYRFHLKGLRMVNRWYTMQVKLALGLSPEGFRLK